MALKSSSARKLLTILLFWVLGACPRPGLGGDPAPAGAPGPICGGPGRGPGRQQPGPAQYHAALTGLVGYYIRILLRYVTYNYLSLLNQK